ncbi:MAG: sugar ABC transporter permease [Paenibacillaceae bacterium]|nr:sugar ABC transporter permease [Paenibacillaceae bacterium]
MLRTFKRELPLHLLIWPGLVMLIVYHYGPMIGIVMAFQNYYPTMGIRGSEWVGLDNFTYLFSLPDTMNVLRNTLSISLMKIAAGLLAPISMALLINEVRITAFKRSVQTMIYLPHFLSWVIAGGILIDILSPSKGIVNQLLASLGIEKIYFLGNNDWFQYVIVSSDQWKEFGFSTIVYLAALTGIDPSLYEASAIDGAGRWRQTWHVSLPGMRPIVFLLMTLSLGNVLNAGFEQVYILYSPQVYEKGDIIDTMVYRMGLVQLQYSMAAAVGLFKAVVSLALVSISYWLAYRFAKYRIF